MTETFKTTHCDDGAWMVHTEGDIIAYAGQGNEKQKAERVAAALNAMTTFIPENSHGVKPGYYTRPDIVRLLRLHKMYPERIQFIADMME